MTGGDPVAKRREGESVTVDDAVKVLAAAVLAEARGQLAELFQEARRPDRGLSPSEARKRLGLGNNKFYAMRNSGEIPQPNAAGTYSEREIEDFLKRDWKPNERRRRARG